MKMNDEINRETMFHNDVVVEIRSADDDSEKQINDIRYFADNGFDIIIVSPNQANSLTPVIKDGWSGMLPEIKERGADFSYTGLDADSLLNG